MPQSLLRTWSLGPPSAVDANNWTADIHGIVMEIQDQLPPHTVTEVSANFLPLSEAVNRLADGMWGGLQRPEPVAVIKQSYKKLSVGFGPWREKAGRLFRVAAVKGKLTIYILAKNQVRSDDHDLTGEASAKPEPVSAGARYQAADTLTRNFA